MRPIVVHIIPHDGVGGVEVAARSMAARNDLQCQFKLLLIAGRSVVAGSDRVVESPFRSTWNPFATLRAAWVARSLEPDVLVFSLWRSVIAACLVRLLRPRTRLAFFLNLDRPAHAVDAAFSKVAVAISHEIWADSEATLQARLGSRAGGGRVVSFVTERLAAPGRPPQPPELRFVSWSRLSRQKGIDRALQFIALLAERGATPHFDIWGPDDGELHRLQQSARQLQIEPLVAFRGPTPRSALASLAAEASFFLQLSRAEGMAMSTVEAMQLGLVPIVTPVGEMARYVRNGENGIVADVENLRQSVDACLRLLTEPGEYQRLRASSLGTWANAPLYADDVCTAATGLASRGSAAVLEARAR